MTRLLRTACFAAVLVGAHPTSAADRSFIITDFDRVEISGDMAVTVEPGRGASVRASGNQRALDRLIVEVRGQVLRVRPMVGGWGGWPGERPAAPEIRIVVPQLRGAYAEGASRLFITKLMGSDVRIGQAGSAAVTVGQVQADKLFINQQGSGTMALQGKAHAARISVFGSGRLDAAKLEATVLDIATSSSGEVVIAGGRTALVRASGAGSVLVTGKPACTVRALGRGEVRCGAQAPKLFGGNE